VGDKPELYANTTFAPLDTRADEIMLFLI